MSEMELRIRMEPSVAIEKKVAMFLVTGHLTHLWEMLDNVTEPEEFRTCCNVCCGPCWALNRLIETNQLDDICRPYKEGWVWWDEKNDRVNRDMLAKAWERTDCHSED